MSSATASKISSQNAKVAFWEGRLDAAQAGLDAVVAEAQAQGHAITACNLGMPRSLVNRIRHWERIREEARERLADVEVKPSRRHRLRK